MANINNVFLLLPTYQSNDFISFKSENKFKKNKNMFRYFNNNSNNTRSHKSNNKKNKKLILTNPTNFSSDKGKFRYNTDLKDDINFIIKSKGININSYVDSKKKIKINNLITENKNKSKVGKYSEEKKDDIDPISRIKKLKEKSRNKLFLKYENNISSQDKKTTFFTNETLSSFYKDIFNLKINLKNSKNFSLYKNRLNKKKNTQTKHSKSEYHLKLKNNDIVPNSARKNKNYFYPYKTKYIFKSRDLIPTIKFQGLPDTVKNMNKYYIESVKFESSKYFGNNFSILKKEKFSAKYRNPLLNNNLLSDRNIAKEEKYNKIKEDIISGKSILNEINLGKIKNAKRKNITPIKTIFFKFKIWLIRFSDFCKLLLIKPYIYLDIYYKNFNYKDITFYETQQIKTSELINSIKSKNLKLSNKLIEQYPTTVLNKDYFEYTPLHWAVRIKFIEIIPNLILYGGDPNAINYLGETPLHLAVKNNDYECTVLLLIFMANPFKKNNKGKKPFDYMKDYQMNMINTTIENLYYKNIFKKSKFFVNNVQNKFIDFIRDEFSTQVSKEALELIEQFINNIKKDKLDEK